MRVCVIGGPLRILPAAISLGGLWWAGDGGFACTPRQHLAWGSCMVKSPRICLLSVT